MNVAIIGGGIGGLMSALLLSKHGFNVTIYEKESRLGGRLAFVEKDGFRIDQGPTIVLLPNMLQTFLDEAGIDRTSYELVKCDPLYSIQFSDGLIYTKYPELNRQQEEIERLFPSEIDGFNRFIKEGRTRFKIGKDAFLEKAFLSQKDFWTRKNVKSLMKLKPYQSVRRLMSNYFEDERLQIAYSLQTLYIGGDPFQAPGMYSLVPFSEHEHGVYYIKGGYASLVTVLEKELRKRNVTIRLKEEVNHFHTSNNQVTGIKTINGTDPYDLVIFNGDYPALFHLLGEKPKRIFTPSSGCVLLYVGLNKIYENANVHQFFISENFSENMKDVFERKVVPKNPSFYTFHPSIIDESLAPPGKGVLYTLIPVPSGVHIKWEQEEKWIQTIIDRMEELAFPRLKESIEWMEIRTPKDASDFGLFKGGSFGIAPTLFQSGLFRPQIKPLRYENLYVVGASVHPGGGVPIVMQGAKILVDQVLRDYAQLGVSVHA